MFLMGFLWLLVIALVFRLFRLFYFSQFPFLSFLMAATFEVFTKRIYTTKTSTTNPFVKPLRLVFKVGQMRGGGDQVQGWQGNTRKDMCYRQTFGKLLQPFNCEEISLKEEKKLFPL
jgi:hypothetical protein